jgi:hypothetical protein
MVGLIYINGVKGLIMKHIGIILLMVITAFLLSSCFESSSSEQHHHTNLGYLKIVNNTNAVVTVTWTADNSHSNVSANSYRIFEFDVRGSITDPKAVSTTYTCDGLYLHSVTFTDEIDLGQTTVRSLYPDRGCIDFVNNTAGHVDVTIPGLNDPITIIANSHFEQAWLLDGQSATANFTFAGDFVFTDSDNMTVNLNETGTYNINATGAAIKVKNMSSVDITQVYLSPNSDLEWGNNDLIGTIAPGNYVTWTVTPNAWDVLVVDINDNFMAYGNTSYFDYNEMLVINYPLPNKNKATFTKNKGAGSGHEGLFKIHQVNLSMPESQK